MSEQIYLSRRNLLMLLSKLDRAANGEVTACTVIKHRNEADPYVQTMDAIAVTAVEDDEYYAGRNAGPMHPSDEVAVATKIFEAVMDLGQTREVEYNDTGSVVPVYTGFQKGREMREAFGLSDFDRFKGEMVTVKFPDNTYSVSSSFLRGLLEDSMKAAASESEFLSRYRVKGPQIVVENFMSSVYRYFILHK